MARTLSRDTTPEAEAVQLERLRRMPPWRKLELVEEACRFVRAALSAGIRMRNPGLPEAEVRRRVRARLVGEALAAAVERFERERR